MALAFNTLEYTKGAEKVGIKREHAEYQAEQMAKFIETNIVVKADIDLMRTSINFDIRTLKDELKLDISKLGYHIESLEYKIVNLEHRLMIKLGIMMLSGITILGFILKY